MADATFFWFLKNERDLPADKKKTWMEKRNILKT